MPDPHDTFAIFAEVAIALAGFSGIIIAIIRRGPGALTALERRRLSNLFIASGSALFYALLGASILHIGSLDRGVLWRSGSALILISGSAWLAYDWYRVRQLASGERDQVNPLVLYPFTVIAALSLGLQVLNVLVLGAPWPFYLGLTFIIAFAFQQFVLLVVTALQRPGRGAGDP